MSATSKQQAAAEAMSKRSKAGKKGWKDIKKQLVIGLGVVCTIAAIYLAATDNGGASQKQQMSGGRGSRADAYVNERYFVSDVTSYAAGNFTAAASDYFNRWVYSDVSYGLDGVSIRGEGMIGFAGALQRCEKTDDTEGGAMPTNFDLRTEMPSCTGGPVLDAGNCSSSYAVAAAAALSARFCYSDPEKYAGTQLSPQQILSCDKKSQGCKGGGIDAVWTYIERRGLFPEKCVPFANGKEAACKSDCDPAQKLKALDHCLLGGGAKVIKREIYNRGPVVAPMYLKDDFMVYKSGVYTPTPNTNQQYGAKSEPIEIAVTIMGWGKSEGTPYWVVKNSWGTSWGEEGYARVAMGTVLREESIIVGTAATEEALAEKAKKDEEAAIRKEELKKERAERDARIREREAQRAAEMAERAAAEEDLDFEDDEELDLDDAEDESGEEA